jgi:LysM repeat protein
MSINKYSEYISTHEQKTKTIGFRSIVDEATAKASEDVQDFYVQNRKVIGNNPNLIKPGQKLKLPNNTYAVVDKGDTLSSLMNRYKQGGYDDGKEDIPTKPDSPAASPKPDNEKPKAKPQHLMIRGVESNHRDYDKHGKPLTSSDGALYAYQVMPNTSKDPGYGVKPAQNDSPEEYNRVGKDYFYAMKKHFKDSEKGAAAYNYGPGNLNKVLAKAEKTGKDWKELLPKETKDYLKKLNDQGFKDAPETD